MIYQKDPIRYVIYARKSSESDDRQVQSIDDQINRLKELARDLNLNVIEILTEAKSAKKPNNRPVFDEVLRKIENREVEGILCWQINRLSRNPIDSGRLSWLLQQGVLKSIQTIDRQYLPDDNVLIFNVETGSANQFILDLKKNVKRGIESKVRKGWAPNIPPLGYLNEKIEKTIVIDPERFHIVRKMWELMLTGAYTPSKILNIATNDLGLRTRVWKKKGHGGKMMSLSGVYKMFSNPFYMGIIRYYGTEYPGKHKAMVTSDEFDKVQKLLGSKGQPRPQHRTFAFTGVIRCGECGCLYTAEIKEKVLKNGQIKKYTYYHCTRRTRRVICSQKKAIRAEVLEVMIEQEISKYSISPDFLRLALKNLAKKNDREIEDRRKLYEKQHAMIVQKQNELDELTKMRCKQLIDDETYIKGRNELHTSITRLKNQLRQTESRAEKWLKLTEKTFLFATHARSEFLKGGLELKKEILLAIGETPIIKGGTLKITPHEWLAPIEKFYSPLQQELQGLELNKDAVNIERSETITPIVTRWHTLVEDVRKVFENLNDDSIHIPNLTMHKRTNEKMDNIYIQLEN